MEDALGTMELRYLTRSQVVLLGLLGALGGLLLVARAAEYVRDREWVLLSLRLVFVGLTTSWAIQGYLLGRRGWVRATRNGIVLRDWLGREYRLVWDQVEQLCVYQEPGSSRLKLHAEGRAFGFNSPTINTKALGNVIVRGAGLTKQRENWWVAVYRRLAC